MVQDHESTRLQEARTAKRGGNFGGIIRKAKRHSSLLSIICEQYSVAAASTNFFRSDFAARLTLPVQANACSRLDTTSGTRLQSKGYYSENQPAFVVGPIALSSHKR